MAAAQWPAIASAAVCMGLAALATAGYAYLVGPVLRSLFAGSGSPLGPVPQSYSGALGELTDWLGRGDAFLLGGLIVAAAAIKGLAFFGQRMLVIRAGQRVLLDLRSRMYRGLLRLNPLERRARAAGDLVSRFTVDVETVEQGVSSGLSALVRDVLQIIALLGLALALDPVLGAIGLIALPLIAALIVRIGRELRRRRRQVHETFGELGGAVEETAAGLDVIQSFGAGALMHARFDRASSGLMRRVLSAVVLRALSSPLNEILGAAALALTLWYAHRRIADGLLTPDAFVSFFTALFLLYRPIKGLGQANHAIQSALAALDRLQGLMAQSDGEAPDVPRAPPGPERVELRGVEAGYTGADPVLRGVDLEIRSGTTLAVVGPSGAGKTTLLNLLRGFLKPTGGELLVDGRPLPAGPAGARSLFAPVPQQPFLFDDSIRANVRLGRDGADDRAVEEACRAAGVLEFAGGLPQGLDTVVGPGGASLSMGQRQRICLARALLSRAPILLLDEVTASLDGETERALFEGLVERLADRTVLVVTHRLSTARSADRIALLEDGAIRAAGPAEALLASDQRLVRLFGGQARAVRTRAEENDVA
jgi:subfamily B ATP-binding cassette protein MsbA